MHSTSDQQHTKQNPKNLQQERFPERLRSSKHTQAQRGRRAVERQRRPVTPRIKKSLQYVGKIHQ